MEFHSMPTAVTIASDVKYDPWSLLIHRVQKKDRLDLCIVLLHSLCDFNIFWYVISPVNLPQIMCV